MTVLLILVIGGAVYFYLDNEMVSGELAAIDSFEYNVTNADKGAQYELRGLPLTAEVKEKLNDDTYQTPHGFSIISYSEKWKGTKLIEIYDELLKNMHGDEMMYVGEVAVYSGKSQRDSEDTEVAGTRSARHDKYPLFFDMPFIVPESLKYTIKPKVSVIELFNMDRYDSADQAARTIAHEYGHHYTMYYFLKDNESALESEYYQLRGIKELGREVIFADWDEYMENYEWDLYEMAAEDYVQLMGSPNAKIQREYMDKYDLLRSGKEKYDPVIDDRTVNVLPQENIYIPLADEVEGLESYYYSFIGEEKQLMPLEKADFNIKMRRKVSNDRVYYNITWDKTSTDKDALYTLVCFNSDGEPYWPVKTVRGDEEPIARVGTPSIIKGTMLHWWSDNIPDEDRIFKLYINLPDGRMQSSEPFYADF